MLEADFIFRLMKTHHVLVILVVDTGVLGYVADSLQERRFASISPTDYKDTKASIFRSKLIGIIVAHRCDCGNVLLVGVGTTMYSSLASHWHWHILVIHASIHDPWKTLSRAN